MTPDRDEWLVQWWPKERPLPEGWRLCEPGSARRCHHEEWSVLIERAEP